MTLNAVCGADGVRSTKIQPGKSLCQSSLRSVDQRDRSSHRPIPPSGNGCTPSTSSFYPLLSLPSPPPPSLPFLFLLGLAFLPLFQPSPTTLQRYATPQVVHFICCIGMSLSTSLMYLQIGLAGINLMLLWVTSWNGT